MAISYRGSYRVLCDRNVDQFNSIFHALYQLKSALFRPKTHQEFLRFFLYGLGDTKRDTFVLIDLQIQVHHRR